MVFCNKNTKNTNIRMQEGHNPYFNRWFSAIRKSEVEEDPYNESQSLF